MTNKFVSFEGLSFDDVLILPNYSEIFEDGIDLSCQLTKKIKLAIPLVSSPMDTVTEANLAIELAKNGGIGIIHRNLSIEKEANEVKKVKNKKLLVGAAIGASNDLWQRIAVLIKAGCDVLCLDSGHGQVKYIIETTREIKKRFPKMELISGNVATNEGTEFLIKAGADGVRVGMGPGSICTTRIISGMGVPQITAIMEAKKAGIKYGVPILADGGIKYSGDIAKALAAGGNTVMIGSLFAGCKEAPGNLVKISGKEYKYYRGMGSEKAMKEGAAYRYFQKKNQKKFIAEGVEGLVPYKGKVKELIFQLIGGLKSGMTYVGAKNLQELFDKGKFIKITNLGLIESHPHNILITNGGENYH